MLELLGLEVCTPHLTPFFLFLELTLWGCPQAVPFCVTLEFIKFSVSCYWSLTLVSASELVGFQSA